MLDYCTRTYRPPDGSAAGIGLSLALAALMLLPSIAAAGAATAGLSVENPSMRFVIKSRPAAGYFTVQNDTGSAVQLTGASSPACGTVMLHQSKNVNGVEKMLPVKSVAVPAHGKLVFAPGGYHLMCMSPTPRMVVGQKVPVTLKFGGGETVKADFPVEGASGTMPMGKMNMGK